MSADGHTVRTPTLEDRIRDVHSRLASEFQGYFSTDDIARYASESLAPYHQARIKDFVPLLVARQTRERLLAQLAASRSG
jgi:hypothetical protein